MKLSDQLIAEKRKLFGIVYKPKEVIIPTIMDKYQVYKVSLNKDPVIYINLITEWIAAVKDVSINDIYSNKRYRSLSDARHILFFLLYYTLPITQQLIATKFNKHHSSIIHAIYKVNTLYVNSLDFREFMKQFDEFYFNIGR